MGVSKNSGKTPQIIHFNKVFHYFHHPFWGAPIFGNTHIVGTTTILVHPLFVPETTGGELMNCSNEIKLFKTPKSKTSFSSKF